MDGHIMLLVGAKLQDSALLQYEPKQQHLHTETPFSWTHCGNKFGSFNSPHLLASTRAPRCCLSTNLCGVDGVSWVLDQVANASFWLFALLGDVEIVSDQTGLGLARWL